MPLGLSLQELGHAARTMAGRFEELAGPQARAAPRPGDFQVATDKGPRTIPADLVAPFL
ncbi:MAG: hypothetical protein HY330_02825, partial [Chloroflexi bacterium]|nr:hypothetical protein [Chloroflexota bacterium]